MNTSSTSPGRNRRTNARRSCAVIGSRSVRADTSAALGGGIRLRPQTATRNTGRKMSPVSAGIHGSEIPAPSSLAPAAFTTPLATTYAHDSPAPR
ncbi:MAG: hypothetical protein E6J91_37755, partial [Deltaproteobacteria bacterium]